MHTPGPWKVIEREILEDKSVYPRRIDGGVMNMHVCFLETPAVAHAYTYSDGWKGKGFSEFQQGNARLIAAAPDLYAALLAMFNEATARHAANMTEWTDAEYAARAALAKVEV